MTEDGRSDQAKADSTKDESERKPLLELANQDRAVASACVDRAKYYQNLPIAAQIEKVARQGDLLDRIERFCRRFRDIVPAIDADLATIDQINGLVMDLEKVRTAVREFSDVVIEGLTTKNGKQPDSVATVPSDQGQVNRPNNVPLPVRMEGQPKVEVRPQPKSPPGGRLIP